MDPGTAVGVASMGIQVCQGLLEYYQSWKGYEEDIREAYSAITELSRTFKLLEEGLTMQRTSTLVSQAQESLMACKDGVQQLEKKLKKLHKEAPNGFKEKAHASRLRLLYPFKKSTLEKFKEITQELLLRLAVAIDVLVLDHSSVARDKVEQVATTVGDIQTTVGGIESIATQTYETVFTTRTRVDAIAASTQSLLTAEEERRLDEIIQWLAAPDPTVIHRKAREDHEPGTGEWMLSCQEYQDWLTGSQQVLWLHGKAGCCKTVLCSTIVEDVTQRLSSCPRDESVLAYFYFSFTETAMQRYTGLLLSIITTLSVNRRHLAQPVLSALYEESKPRQPTPQSLEGALVTLIKQFRTSYLVVDALDECPEQERAQVMQGLKRITRASSTTRLLITSRKEADIENFVQFWCETQLQLDEACVNKDIDMFVEKKLVSDNYLSKLSEPTKEQIRSIFHVKSDGMFRWAALQLESLQKLKIPRLEYVSKILNAMPGSLHDTYERILDSINDTYFMEVRTALEWISSAYRPISVAELAEACNIRITDHCGYTLLDDGQDAVAGLLGVISSLVILEYVPSSVNKPHKQYMGEYLPKKFDSTSYDQRIRLAHYSVKEFLFSDQLQVSNNRVSRYALKEPQAQYNLARNCSAYFLYFANHDQKKAWIDAEEPPATRHRWYLEHSDLEYFAPTWPLLRYAVEHWHMHQKQTEDTMKIGFRPTPLHLAILENEVWRVLWLRLDHIGKGLVKSRKSGAPIWHDGTNTTIGIYWASFLGLRQTLSHLFNKPHLDVDCVQGKHGTALQAAAFRGYEEIMRFLMCKGASVNAKGGLFQTPLQSAAVGGYTHIVELLLQANADVNVEGGRCGSALRAAASRGHEVIVSKLLHAGAKVDLTGPVHGTALQLAAHKGHDKIVQMLVQHGADPNIQGGAHVVALLAGFRFEPIVRTLIQAGADVNITGGEYGSALQGAVMKGSTESAKLLIEAGANVNITGGQHGSALQEAVSTKQTEIVNLLIQAGADVSITGGREYTPLQDAVRLGSIDLVELLIEAGADINLPVKKNLWTCHSSLINQAAAHCPKRVVEMFIQRGASVDYQTFQAATAGRYGWNTDGEAVAELLVKAVSKIEEPEKWIYHAACARFKNVIKLLLHDHGKKIYEDGSTNLTAHNTAKALILAAGAGRDYAVSLLLDLHTNGEDSLHVKYSTQALQHALAAVTRPGILRSFDYCGPVESLRRNIAIAQILINAGADMYYERDGALAKAVSSSENLSSHKAHALQAIHLIEVLLKKGEDVVEGRSINFPEITCTRECMLYSAARIGNVRLVQLLLDLGIDVNGYGHLVEYWGVHGQKSSKQKSVLHGAVSSAEVDVVRLVLDHGANVKTIDAAEACDLLVAALESRATDQDLLFIATLILERMFQVRDSDDPVFDEIASAKVLRSKFRPWWSDKERFAFIRKLVTRLVKERAFIHGVLDTFTNYDSGLRDGSTWARGLEISES
ncbi:uncharacterized protein N0V89_011451 [Didymosphaeria variabile]|uniref:NACHT domain-containing protein n=1 Tax=Didymosphaeria variabile TaxID=1932322 RepID=A0A9W8XA21_9PLEO|nr:uncharacterized protein N0V89_011451 [Didymosphaeria variabile]KAJ4345321.1 hypothetical protein N0V89_011451 [Didymosphaeria variabile]